MRTLAPIVGLILLSGSDASAGEKPVRVPLRYQGLNQTKYFELKEVLGHPEQAPALGHTAVYSADGKRGLFAGGGTANIDGKTDESFLSLWDIASGQAVREIRIPGKAITVLALSPDGKLALTGLYANDGKAMESAELTHWNLETGKPLHTFSLPIPKDKQPPEVYFSAAYSPDGKTALVGGSRGNVQYLNLEKGVVSAALSSMKDETRPCLSIRLRNDKHAVLAWGNDVQLWDLAEKKSMRAYKGAGDAVLTLALSPDGKTLAGSTLDDAVHVWDVEKGVEIAKLRKGAANAPLISLAFAGNDKLLIVWTGNDPATGIPAPAVVQLWDPRIQKEIWSRPAKLEGLVPISAQGKHAVLGGAGNLFSLWNLTDGTVEKVWGGHKTPVTALVALPDHLVSAGQDGNLKSWKGMNPQSIPGHADAVFSLRKGADGSLLTGSADKTVKLWDGKTGKLLQTFTGHTQNVMGVTFMPGQKWIASAGGDRVIRTWDRETGKPIAVISGHSEGINALAASPDGKWLATASDDNTVRLWPMDGGKLVKDIDIVFLEGHKRQVTSLAFTEDGKQLLSGSQDKTIRVWDLAKQRTARILEGHQNWISSVLVWNDKVLSTADDFRVFVWDLKNGKIVDVIDLTPYGDCPRSLALAADGNGFFVGTSGWVVMRFEQLTK